MDPAPDKLAAIEFGRFSVSPRRREFLVEGHPLDLGGRAFEVLLALIETPGAVLSKDELLERAWPNRIVEENNLQAQISTLRKALGDDRDLIRTISGRGYQFTGVTRAVGAASAAPPLVAAADPAGPSPGARTNLPEGISEFIGRDAELDEVFRLATSHRLVTLTGAGGMGKTRLAIEAGRRLLARFPDGVWIADLGRVTDAALTSATVAGALGIEVSESIAPTQSLVGALRGKELLLVLDSCEHVIDAAAELAETLLRASPTVSMIATSRDPLRVDGEWVFPVPPLAVPSDSERQTSLLSFGAVQLFVERARASSPRFALDDRTLAAVSSLTRRLDGIPLAIELAAARVEALGVEAIAALLDDRLDLLTSGRRTALPRQRTLRATLDWSYDLLSEDERLAVRRLSIFAGGFTPEAAGAVVAVPPVADTIVELVAKSLVNAKVDGAAVRFRMLETTRAYALEKLIESDERGDVAQRHAEYYRDLFRHAAAESAMRPASEWWAAYGIEIDNLRAALDWAFSPAGDPSVGVALTVASTPHWFRYSGIEEYRRRLEQALASLQHGSGEDARNELELVLARAQLLRFENTGAQALRQAWAGALRLAEAFGEPRYRARALWGLWGAVVRSGEPRAGLALAEQFSFLAQGAADVADRYVAGRMMGVSLHYLGDQINARRHIERMLDSCPNPAPASHSIGFSYDNRETSRAMLTRVLWLQGFPDQAAQLSASIFADVKALNHQPTLRYVLSWALCPIAILAGDLKTAESFLDLLSDPSADQWLDMTAHLTRCLRGVLLLRQDDAGVGLRQLEEGLEDLDRTGSSQYNYFLGALAEGLGQAGHLAEARAAIEKALARAVRNEELWCFAELSRVKGMLVLAEDSADAESEAEALFLQGVESARGQGALSWELRCATSLAGLRRDQGHRREAREALAPVLDRFTEGFATPDLRAAKSLLSKLS